MAERRKKQARPVTRQSRTAGASYDQWARRTLAADAELGAEYLREVLEHSDTPEELLLGLRHLWVCIRSIASMIRDASVEFLPFVYANC